MKTINDYDKLQENYPACYFSYGSINGYGGNVAIKAGLLSIKNVVELDRGLLNVERSFSVYFFDDLTTTNIKVYRERMDKALKNINN